MIAPYRIVEPILIVAELFCLIPFTYLFNGNEKTKFCVRKNVLYYVRLSMLVIGVAVLVIQGEISISRQEESIHGIGLIIQFVHFHYHLLTAIVCTLFTNYHGHNLIKVLHELVEVQKQFQQLGFEVNYNKGVPRMYVVNILFIVKVIVLVASYFVWTHQYSLLYDILHLSLHTISTLWMLYLFLIELNINKLNTMFGYFEQNRSLLKTKTFTIMLFIGGEIYSKLYEINFLVIKSFAWQFIVVIPQVFLEIVLHTFHIFKAIKNQTSIEEISITVDIIYFWILLNIVVSTVLTKNKINLLIDTVTHIAIRVQIEHQEWNELLSRMMLQLHHHKITFSAKGVFPLDGTLIYSTFFRFWEPPLRT